MLYYNSNQSLDLELDGWLYTLTYAPGLGVGEEQLSQLRPSRIVTDGNIPPKFYISPSATDTDYRLHNYETGGTHVLAIDPRQYAHMSWDGKYFVLINPQTGDVVYLNRARKVLKIRPSMVKSRMSICLSAHSVLELPDGTLAKTGTQAGDQLEFEKYG